VNSEKVIVKSCKSAEVDGQWGEDRKKAVRRPALRPILILLKGCAIFSNYCFIERPNRERTKPPFLVPIGEAKENSGYSTPPGCEKEIRFVAA
jgi:hypothetical protein